MTSVLIPVYKGVTHLDFTGPHQFLSRTPGIEVVVASMGATPIESYGLTFSNLADLALVERCDVLCLPGGWDA
jgi:cyclohexyl-isocyanide hydratase